MNYTFAMQRVSQGRSQHFCIGGFQIAYCSSDWQSSAGKALCSGGGGSGGHASPIFYFFFIFRSSEMIQNWRFFDSEHKILISQRPT